MVYRWLLCCYFLGWLVASWVYYTDGPKYLTYLTNWGFMTYNSYLLVAALSTLGSFLSDYKDNTMPSTRDESINQRPLGCCGYKTNKLRWYQMIQWFLFTVGSELAFVIMCLFWTMLYRGGEVDRFSANVHLVNGLVALIDFWVTAIPVNLLHFVYLMVYSMVYSLFNGIYFATTKEIIYPVLDYENKLGAAIAIVLISALIIVPIIHTVFYLMYLLKVWILHCCFGQSQTTGDEESRPIVDKEFDDCST